MKSKLLLFTAAIFILLSHSNAQTPEFVMDNVSYLAVSDGKLFLEASDSKKEYFGLWISDGTATGSKFLKELRTPRNNRYIECKGLTYFMAQAEQEHAELWVTDGTPAGTTLVKKLNPAKTGSSFILSAFNNKLFFIGEDAEHGKELWVSDGTENGTKLLKDINPGEGHGLDNGYSIVYKNKLYFIASREQFKEELWVTDGTEAGTKLFKASDPEGNSYLYINKIFNGKFYYTTSIYRNNVNEMMLWVSDGTDAGTHVALGGKYSGANILEFNGKGFFLNYGGTETLKLWSTDGTEAGTTMVEDSVGSYISVFSGELYYGKIVSKKVISYNYALYKTNGNPGGTNLVKVISGGKSTDRPGNFVQANGKLYFLCNYDNSGANYLNNDLWETDGTAANTKLIAYSPGDLVDVNRLTGLTGFNNALYFTDLGYKLYRIGTPNTAVTEIAHNNFEMVLFPNPTSNQLTLKTDEKLIGSNYTVLNIMGQTVRSGKISSNNTLLEVGSLPGGSYFVRVQSKEGIAKSRFIKVPQ